MIPFIFFGTDSFSVTVLHTLAAAGHLPTAVVTAPDRPAGKGLKIQSSAVSQWAVEKNIPVLKPVNLTDGTFLQTLADFNVPVFTLASYGKIIPQVILDIPQHGVLNVHPSLLPDLRGASPLETAILTRDTTGVTLMQMDAQMDHGPIIYQESLDIKLPVSYNMLRDATAKVGGNLLARALVHLDQNGDLPHHVQDHTAATFTKIITKTDAELLPTDSADAKYRKVLAYEVWPRAWFLHTTPDGKEVRTIVTKATLVNNLFMPQELIPAGRKPMDLASFENGYGKLVK